jgi:hypothetical protein
MHGFLNVFLAAAFVRCAGADERRAAEVLSCTDAGQFHFTEEGVRFGGLFAEDLCLAESREAFALSYGSCSLDEPIADMRGLGLL